jgi:2'-5' RNA ligase
MRVFVAVRVPDGVKEAVSALGTEIAGDGISLVKSANMHLTIRFIGEAQPGQIRELERRLAGIRFAKFNCRVRGVGVFPDEHHVRVVWARAESGGALEALAKDVAGALKGFGGDERFSAHLTMARVKRKMDPGPFLRKHKDDDFGSFEVASFELIESVLGGPLGPQYRTIGEFKATG